MQIIICDVCGTEINGTYLEYEGVPYCDEHCLCVGLGVETKITEE